LNPDLVISRSVGTTAATNHYAHVMNIGKGSIDIASGSSLATVCPFMNDLPATSNANYPHVESQEDRKAFEDALKELDCNPDLTTIQRKKIEDSLQQNRHAFSYESRRLGKTNLAIMNIETGDAKPIFQASYRVSLDERRIIDETLAELLADDLIEESDSSWASPAIRVCQRGSDRFCNDFRKINKVTKADQYPIPRSDDILSQFTGKA
jgi:hypothetical protein